MPTVPGISAHGRSVPLNGADIRMLQLVDLTVDELIEEHTSHLSFCHNRSSDCIQYIHPVCLGNNNDNLGTSSWSVDQRFRQKLKTIREDY